MQNISTWLKYLKIQCCHLLFCNSFIWFVDGLVMFQTLLRVNWMTNHENEFTLLKIVTINRILWSAKCLNCISMCIIVLLVYVMFPCDRMPQSMHVYAVFRLLLVVSSRLRGWRYHPIEMWYSTISNFIFQFRKAYSPKTQLRIYEKRRVVEELRKCKKCCEINDKRCGAILWRWKQKVITAQTYPTKNATQDIKAPGSVYVITVYLCYFGRFRNGRRVYSRSPAYDCLHRLGEQAYEWNDKKIYITVATAVQCAVLRKRKSCERRLDSNIS